MVFDYVFNQHYSSLCVYAMQFVDNPNAVEDLVQDFFVYLWLEFPRLQINVSLKAYLFTSIKNRCLDYQKHNEVRKKYKKFVLSSENKYDSTEFAFAESELRQAIQASLRKLSPRCREIFEFSRIHGLSNQEISEKLGISKRTVELQISNSLKILRKELVEFLPISLTFWLFY